MLHPARSARIDVRARKKWARGQRHRVPRVVGEVVLLLLPAGWRRGRSGKLCCTVPATFNVGVSYFDGIHAEFVYFS